MNTEKNKIIAVFMGLSYCEKYQFEGWYKNHEHNERVYDLLYHSDWNWLMEVIFKITKLGVSYDDKGNELFLKIGENLLMLKIQPTYDAVVNLINWYNEQK